MGVVDKLLKEIHSINKKNTFNDQVKIKPREDNLNLIELDMHVPSGLHRGADYKFLVKFYNDGGNRIEPFQSIYHPNMSSYVCCNLFGETSELGLEGVIVALYDLLDHPEFGDPINDFWRSSMEDSYEEDLSQAMRGSELYGRTFSCVLRDKDDCNDSD